MLGSTLYLVGFDGASRELLPDAMPCSMCTRNIINAGIKEVVIRKTKTEYITIPVQSWIDEDDTLPDTIDKGE